VAAALGKTLREKTFTAPNGKRFHLTVSIGIAAYPHDAQNASDLLAGMDVAMYRAKEMGKDGACTLDTLEGRVEVGRTTRDYAENLREALQQNRIIPYYHSIVDCKSGDV
jgi:predicted signal transduction protein with EAL and GGDEF domain